MVDEYNLTRIAALTMNEVRLRLAEEDAKDVVAGTVISHEMKPGAFLEVGLNLEEQQYVSI